MKHISGFDYLRVFFSILVVVWHAQAVSFLGKINENCQDIVNIFYYNICLLAVPVFFSISLFLFYKKELINKNSFPQNRLFNLLVLYFIWMFIGIVANIVISQGNYIFNLFNLQNIFYLIIQGSRPELYFLYSLIVISYLALFNGKYLLNRKNRFWIQLFLLIFSFAVLWFVNFLTLVTHQNMFSAYWNPICFIPYIFSTSILAILDDSLEKGLMPHFQRKSLFIISILMSSFILLSWLEWRFFKYPQIFGYLLPPYARVSLVIGAFILCYCANLHTSKTPSWIHSLSQNSLGIYLLHNYFLLFFGFLMSKLGDYQQVFNIILHPIIQVILAVAISVFLSKLIKRYKIGRIIFNSSTKNYSG